METQGLTKAAIISALLRSPHASAHAKTRENDPRSPAERLRDAYMAPPLDLRQAVLEDPEFVAHLTVWNHVKGEIRDAKVALPVLQLAFGKRPDPALVPFRENALAHMADFNPKLLVKALDFLKLIGGPKHLTLRFVRRYLRDLEADPREWETTALQHQAALTTLYARYHIDRPLMVAQGFNWKDKAGLRPQTRLRKFEIVRGFPTMSPLEIVAAIDRHKLPWLVVRGALGARVKEPEILMALVGRMTAADLATSAKWLVKAGVMDHAVTRAAFEQLLEKAVKPRRAKGSTLKVTKAVKALREEGDEKLAGKLQAVQEKQLEQMRTVEGNWLIIADKSNSMQHTIELAKQVAAILGRSVKGDVHLIFCDTDPRYVGNVSGKSLAAIERVTAAVQAGGGTSLGVGLKYARAQGWALDGITIVSDGAENTHPQLAMEYAAYCREAEQQHRRTPTVYWYRVAPDRDPRTPNWILNFQGSMASVGADMTVFDLTAGTDEYALPNLVQTMRAGKYSLLDEIMATRLRTLDEVLPRTVGIGVLSGQKAVSR